MSGEVHVSMCVRWGNQCVGCECECEDEWGGACEHVCEMWESVCRV